MCVLCGKCAVRVSCCLPADGDKRSAGAAVRVDRDRRREGKGYGGGMGGGEQDHRAAKCGLASGQQSKH